MTAGNNWQRAPKTKPVERQLLHLDGQDLSVGLSGLLKSIKQLDGSQERCQSDSSQAGNERSRHLFRRNERLAG